MKNEKRMVIVQNKKGEKGFDITPKQAKKLDAFFGPKCCGSDGVNIISEQHAEQLLGVEFTLTRPHDGDVVRYKH